jgi:5-methylcytosine-specific restriction enzyme A
MPNRPLTPCRHPGCPALLDKPGYCGEHKIDRRREDRRGFDGLDAKKTGESKAFYSSRRWGETSKLHRQKEPLCRRCRARGLVVAAQMVHHNPPREEIIAAGESPYDGRFLESLCNRCHLEELRAKRSAAAPGGGMPAGGQADPLPAVLKKKGCVCLKRLVKKNR